MRVCRYRRQTQLEGYMYGVTFRLSWPNGVSTFSFPWFPLSPFVHRSVCLSEKDTHVHWAWAVVAYVVACS